MRIFQTNSSSSVCTPLKTVRRAPNPQLPTGKTPMLNSTMKLRTQKLLQTSKRTNIDQTASTIVTPAKQRCLVNQVTNKMKTSNTIANISSNSFITANTSTGFKTSTVVRSRMLHNKLSCLLLFVLTFQPTPGKRPILKRGIPTPIRTQK